MIDKCLFCSYLRGWSAPARTWSSSSLESQDTTHDLSRGVIPEKGLHSIFSALVGRESEVTSVMFTGISGIARLGRLYGIGRKTGIDEFGAG